MQLLAAQRPSRADSKLGRERRDGAVNTGATLVLYLHLHPGQQGGKQLQ